MPTGPTWALAMSPDNQYVYACTASDDNYVWRVKVNDDSVLQIPLFDVAVGWGFGMAKGIAISRDGRALFPATQSYRLGTVYSHETGWLARLTDLITPAPKVEALSLESAFWGICVSPNNRDLYITTSGGVHRVPVDDPRKFLLQWIPMGSDVFEVKVSPDNRWLYATTRAGLKIVDTGTNQVVKSLAIGWEPRGLAFSPDGKYAYAGAAGVLAVVDVASQQVIRTFALGADPFAIDVAPDPFPPPKGMPWLFLLLGD